MNAGTYVARAVEWEFGWTKNQNEQVAVSFEATEGDFAGERIAWFGFFTDKTQKRTVESLRLCGWKGTDLSDLSGLDANEVKIVVAEEEYEGKVTLKVQWVNSLTGGGIALKQVMTDAEKRTFAARMKSVIKGLDAQAGTPRAASRPAPRERASAPPPVDDAPPLTDDDIPF